MQTRRPLGAVNGRLSNSSKQQLCPVDIVEMEVSAAFPTNYLRHLRFKANIMGQLKIRTCVSATQLMS